ncbi:MAG: homocitrate synthase [Candidatus Saelkia tenebricola]|nr:homocitrate synthase [Candidatus Saelkia tenebricola]
MDKKQPKIYLVDVTNRDGVQTSRLSLSKLEKTMVNMFLNEMGVFQSEMGFPVTNHEINYINANVELFDLGVLSPLVLSGWVRAIAADVEIACRQTNIKNLNLSISTSKQMIDSKFKGKYSKEDVISMMVEAVKMAKENKVNIVGVNAEDASRTDDDYLYQFAKAAKDNGADRLRYCDTLGYDDPFTIYKRIYELAKKVDMPIEVHCHNDLGMAVATSIAGAKAANDAGVDAYINTTINGMGERAGNADLLATILAIKYSSGFTGKYLLDEKVDLSKAWKIARYGSFAFKVPIPINQPGVGANMFAHESGIHADGALKDSRNYELYHYEDVGRGEPVIIETGRQITVGEYSGIKGFRNVYEKLEVEFKDEEEAKNILELARFANVHKQKPLVGDELLFIAKYPEITKKILTMVA